MRNGGLLRMKFISWIGFIPALIYGTEYEPWFAPPFEFQGRIGAFYERAHAVQTPLGSFDEPTRNASAHFSLAVTPWPYWNVETEVFVTHTADTTWTYEAARLTLRYAWLDEDPFSLVTGVTLSFPSTHFLHELSFPYHGHANGELHVTGGKEWPHGSEWNSCLWGLVGYGVAEKGSPWLHGIGSYAHRLSSCLNLGIFTEMLYGFGDKNIIPLAPFSGYASIHHQTIDLGGYLELQIRYWGILKAIGWYRLYAHNFTEKNWGLSLTLLIPFSVI